ncbi:MAG: twin-arginine translocase subunit TatC [Acidimicrobiia bacterium]|nr:twin-arginine translocase subunit TatC [Acidimicrobiia bacterium]NNC42433.1 twin-arginine translocase subunit TatC [Acidimicrobiia bacterium]NNL26846.1 twin-arginine translocase subunit TatC [Acidimicrobiia bacterium]
MTTEAMPLMGHLRELRDRLAWAAGSVVVLSIVSFFLRDWLLDLIQNPWERVTDDPLNFFEPAESLSIVMRLSLFGGIVFSTPIWTYHIWAFVSPALTKREKKWVVPLILSLTLLFVVGTIFAYWTMPQALRFLLGFGETFGNTVGVSAYVNFAIRYLLVFGLAFQYPVFLFAAGAAGLVRTEQLRSVRRYVAFGILVVSAGVTPGGDPFTLLVLAGPLYVMYELTILAIKYILKK